MFRIQNSSRCTSISRSPSSSNVSHGKRFSSHSCSWNRLPKIPSSLPQELSIDSQRSASGLLLDSVTGSCSQMPVSAISGGPLHGIQYPLETSSSSWPGAQVDAPTKKLISSIFFVKERRTKVSTGNEGYFP